MTQLDVIECMVCEEEVDFSDYEFDYEFDTGYSWGYCKSCKAWTCYEDEPGGPS